MERSAPGDRFSPTRYVVKYGRDMETYSEREACVAIPVNEGLINPACALPYGLTANHILKAMAEFIDFISFINQRLNDKGIARLETFLMPANFSSIVGEFVGTAIPRYCSSLVRNRYHNGHPDLIPRGMYVNDAVQHSQEGIEIKCSRYSSGWQGHNPEAIWLMVFHFSSNTVADQSRGIGPIPFRFVAVYAAKLEKDDWSFSGRSATGRRTITASVNQRGLAKMRANWIYLDLD